MRMNVFAVGPDKKVEVIGFLPSTIFRALLIGNIHNRADVRTIYLSIYLWNLYSAPSR